MFGIINMMTDGMIVNQREIVLMPIPYSNFSKYKKRPVVILSNKEFNSKNEDIICCILTSNPRDYRGTIKINTKDLESGNLRYESRIKSNRILTADKKLIIKKLAKLNINKSKEVVKKLNLNIKIEE